MDIESQIQLEELFSKNQLLPRLRAEFDHPAIRAQAELHKIPVVFAVDLLAKMVLHKRATVSMLVGMLWYHFAENQDEVPETKILQTTADLILKAAEADLVDYEDISGQIVFRIDVSDDVYEDLERYQYPLPMVVAPKPLRTNRDTGYWSEPCAKGSVILRSGHHDDDVCLDHLNRVNQVALSINFDTAEMVLNTWRHLDRQKEDETKIDYEKRVKAFEKYDRTARDVMQHLGVAGNRFYLTHRYDKRGRSYAQGYHVNTQGNAWNKAVVEFADKEVLNDA